MALETLKDVKEIGGFPINHMEKRVTPEEYEAVRKFVNINHDENTITFKLQNGAISEVKKQQMLQDFKYYLAKVNESNESDWDTEALHAHALKCIAENSQDWQDFNAKYGNDYSGVNGCQVETIIAVAYHIIYGFNEKLPSDHNEIALNALNIAIGALMMRTKERKERGVEGTSQK